MTRMMSRTLDWFLAGLVCVAAPFVHFYIQRTWSVMTMPYLPSASRVAMQVSLIAMDACGAAIAATLLMAPLALLTSIRPLVAAGLLATATFAVTAYVWEGSAHDWAALLTVVEALMFFMLCWAAGVLISRVRSADARISNA
jgi:hypothetical protein